MGQPSNAAVAAKPERKHFTRKVMVPDVPMRKLNLPPEKKAVEIELTKFETVILKEVKQNIGVILTMGDGSLPFLVGLLAAKFQLVFTNEDGFIRSRFLKATINNLMDLKLLKIQATNKFPLGPGRISLV